MKYLKTFNEASAYKNLHDNDEADITEVIPDKNHDYERCDGVLYELSNTGNDEVVDIDLVEYTPENTFYQDQIDRYVEYIEDGGTLQTFPVTEYKICNNLDEMLEYFDDLDNFDEYYDLMQYGSVDNKTREQIMLAGSMYHQKLYDIKLYDIQCDPEEYGFKDDTDLSKIKNEEDLDKYYNEDEEEIDEEVKENKYDSDLYLAFVDVINYFNKDKRTYTLTDFNHRFAALKELGKKSVYVEVTK